MSAYAYSTPAPSKHYTPVVNKALGEGADLHDALELLSVIVGSHHLKFVGLYNDLRSLVLEQLAKIGVDNPTDAMLESGLGDAICENFVIDEFGMRLAVFEIDHDAEAAAFEAELLAEGK